MGFTEFKNKIRKRETPFYEKLYRIAKNLRGRDLPYIKFLHDLLYHERRFRLIAWRTFWRLLYHQPLFRSRCFKCGDNLHIYHSGQGLPYIQGDLEITIGNNVSIYDQITIASLTIGENPRLTIGDNTDISQPITITVGNEVIIGSHCLIGCTLITDNQGHNIKYQERFEKLDKAKIGRVEIGDYVWAALQSIIIGNVTIGFGAVIGARAVVTKDVPPFCVVTGNPARIVKKLPFPEELINDIGKDQYENYLNANVEG
ncbi:MAG: acyltransferase [Candidatus Krumholzibacteriota bacterium]|nr:acyltransferase [Candidatus Krumholzibacteriota bacterium]